MKYSGTLLLVAVMLVGFSSSTAFAQAGIYWPANVLEEGQLVAGPGIVFGSFPTFGIVGQVRYGMAENLDISPKFAFARDSKLNFFTVGGDLRYGYLQEAAGDDYDVSFVGAFSVTHRSKFTWLTLGFGGQFGRSIPIEGSDTVLAPYGGLLLGVSHASIADNSDTSFGGILPIGNQFTLKENLAAHFELDVLFGTDTELQVALGINYLY
ncbi:MAG: hypothetical protein ACE5OP_04490 [Candidatus Glassbacteria bacterium]